MNLKYSNKACNDTQTHSVSVKKLRSILKNFTYNSIIKEKDMEGDYHAKGIQRH